MNRSRSIFPWSGGKAKIKKQILPYLEGYNKKNISCLIECFFGAGNIMLNVETIYSNLIANDYDDNIYAVFKTLQDDVLTDKLFEKLYLTPYHEKFRKESYEMLLLKGEKLSDFDKAYHFLYCSWTSFGGITYSKTFGISINSSRGNGSEAITYLRREENVRNYIEKIKSIQFQKRDYSYILKRYEREDCLHFLDPPYANTAQVYNSSSFDSQKFFNLIKDYKSNVVLTHTQDDFTEDLIKNHGWLYKELNVLTYMNKNTKNKRNEIILFNPRMVELLIKYNKI